MRFSPIVVFILLFVSSAAVGSGSYVFMLYPKLHVFARRSYISLMNASGGCSIPNFDCVVSSDGRCSGSSCPLCGLRCSVS